MGRGVYYVYTHCYSLRFIADRVLSCIVYTIALANGRANVQSMFSCVTKARADVWTLSVAVCMSSE